MSLPDIVAAAVRPGCEVCMGCGWVCEEHPLRPWEGFYPPPLGCECLAPGMPCRCTGMDGPQ